MNSRVRDEGDRIEYSAILGRWENGYKVTTSDLVDALAWRAANQRREIARLSKRVTEIAMVKALLSDCVEHLEWSTPEGSKAWQAAKTYLSDPQSIKEANQ